MTSDTPPMPENETAARQAIAVEPDSAIAYYHLGYLLMPDPNRASEAETALRRAIELDPNSARYSYRLALLLHEQLQRFEEAEIAYRRAVEIAPDDPFYYSGLINFLVQQSRRAEALTLSTRMRALLNTSQHWYGLAVLDAILGNVEAAIDSLRQAARQPSFDHEWARKDPDLASIRTDPRFEEIVGHPIALEKPAN
jgi:tetratricopeptide (TPR) repeat protein